MKRRSLCQLPLLAGAILFASHSDLRAQSLSDDVKASMTQLVVRVIADEDGKKQRVGTGFIWPDAGHAVTALHVVAGDDEVIIEYAASDKVEPRRARLERLNQAADLALLSIEDPLDRQPGNVVADPATAQGELWVLGFPLGLRAPRSRHLAVSDIAPTLLSEGMEAEDRKRLTELGFPALDIQVIHLEGDLVPGDSGAPIFNASGEIVAAGIGGLRGGTIGLGWGMPSREIAQLPDSSETSMNLSAAALSRVRNLFIYTDQPATARDSVGVRTFRTSFESTAGKDDEGRINAFVAAEPVFEVCSPLSAAYTVWRRTENAHTGRYAVNLIPEGNPKTQVVRTNYCQGPTLTVSAAILDTVFDTAGSDSIDMSYFRLTTSNPRPQNVHNCDSAMDIFISRDGEDWEHYSAQCGQYKAESDGWWEMRFSIPTNGAQTMQLAFTYELQNSDQSDPDAVYLIDDLEIRVHN